MPSEAVVVGRIVAAFLEAGWKPGPREPRIHTEVDSLERTFRLTLTSRELEVLGCYAHGGTEPTIAADLGVTQSTIRSHTRTARRRLGVHTTTHAVALAVAAGLIEMDTP